MGLLAGAGKEAAQQFTAGADQALEKLENEVIPAFGRSLEASTVILAGAIERSAGCLALALGGLSSDAVREIEGLTFEISPITVRIVRKTPQEVQP
jgi:hypothetical protein